MFAFSVWIENCLLFYHFMYKEKKHSGQCMKTELLLILLIELTTGLAIVAFHV